MSWLYSRALVEEFSAATCSAGARSALSNTNPTPQAFLPPDRMTAFSRPSRFGMTFAPLTESLGKALLTWFRADSRVRTFPLPGLAPESMASAPASGGKWHELSVRYDLASSSWKTHRCLWDEALPWSSVTLPSWGMTRTGVLSAPPMSGRPISATASGLWPTPMVHGNYNRPGASKNAGMGLASAVKLWPTPVRRDYRAPGRSRMERTGSKAGECLPQVVGGQLNPTWVEWLMNWPLGWTSLEPMNHENFKHWQESGAAYFQGNRMREMWFDRDPSEASQGQESAEQFSGEHRDSLPGMPQGRTHEGWNMGKREGGTCHMQDMREHISAETDKEIVNMWEGMSIGAGKDQCREALEIIPRTMKGISARADRLKAIGNGQVPRVAAAAFALLSAEYDRA